MLMKDKLAVQMFTLRDFTNTWDELATTLQKVSKMGYSGIQLSAVGCMNGVPAEASAAQAKQLLDDNNLRCIATHRSWDNLKDRLEEEIAFHKALNCDYCAIGTVPVATYPHTYDAYRRWLDDAQPVITALKAAGIRFGHHNHAREFSKPERHGKMLEDILIDEGGDDLMMELDLYWIAFAGVSCERILDRCHGRVPVIHLKDIEPLTGSNECRIAAVGEGSMEWEHIIPACERAGVDWYTMEQDICPRDPFDCLQSSLDYMLSRNW
jgi:sugar phosphate isomerase/epimerase